MPAGARKLTPEPGRHGKARTAQADSDRLYRGLLVGRGFRLERSLSHRGTVWLATSPEGQLVALKTGPCGPIEREHRTVASLEHPNILAVTELIDTEHGCFSVGEYLGGGDLVSLAGLHPRHWLAKASALIAALGYLHDRGLVHRDIKPRNVMLDDADQVRLIDFGSAVPAGSPWVQGGTTVVSPSRGVDPVRPADDLYALASLICELLRGAPAGHTPVRPEPGIAGPLARLVDERLAGPAEASRPDLARFDAVIRSMSTDQRILQ